MKESRYNCEQLISAKEARARSESVTDTALEREILEMRMAINRLVTAVTATPYGTSCQLPKMSEECMAVLNSEFISAGYKVNREPFSWTDGSAVYRLDWSR